MNTKIKLTTYLINIFSLALLLTGWQAVAAWTQLPAFILPSPADVAVRFVDVIANGSLIFHAWITLQEILLGLLSGSLFAIAVGYLIAQSKFFDQLLSPYLVASQAVPVVALAPLLIIWFGPGMFSKVLICALIVFFPVLVNTVAGVRAVPPALHDLLSTLNANRWQRLRYLEAPSALSIFLSGLKIGAALSVIGAVVGELIGADKGLGFLINLGRGQYDTALVFVAIITLIILSLILFSLVAYAEKAFVIK